MIMKGKRLFKKLGKNLLAGLGGAIVGVVVLVFWLLVFWIPANAESVGLGIIVVLPVLIILYSFMGVVFGGILGIVVYWVVRFFRKG